jgi:hypothetical protein
LRCTFVKGANVPLTRASVRSPLAGKGLASLAFLAFAVVENAEAGSLLTLNRGAMADDFYGDDEAGEDLQQEWKARESQFKTVSIPAAARILFARQYLCVRSMDQSDFHMHYL